jgi:glycosyltransferase involved in cell wall biosynthesis
VICTFNREDFLRTCLESLSPQTLSRELYEIVVVDNASSDETPRVVQRFAESHPGIRVLCVRENRRGLSVARNTGAERSSGDVILYLDDDATADPNLLREVVRVFQEHPAAGCAGGRIVLDLPDRVPWWYSDRLAAYFSAYGDAQAHERRVTVPEEFPYGANFAVRRTALREVGMFEEAYGRKGRDSAGGEDTELACRLAARGFEIYSAPGAVVTHHIPRERMRFPVLLRQAASAGKKWMDLGCAYPPCEGRAKTDVRLLLRTLVRLFFFVGREGVAVRVEALLHVCHLCAKLTRRLSLRGQKRGTPARSGPTEGARTDERFHAT